MKQNDWLRLYRLCLWGYPAHFRRSYGESMARTLDDALADPAVNRRKLLWRIGVDLIDSIVKENVAMLCEKLAERSIVFQAVLLGIVSSMLALAMYIVVQQVLRRGANDPQLQIAGDAAYALEHDADASSIVGAAQVDAARSLSSFMIVYDDAGRPIASSMRLNGTTPAPPSGVFGFVREHQRDVLTWQPQPGVRIAMVMERIGGGHPGFVLAGRSLREVEAREDATWHMVQIAWLGMVIVLALATFVFSRYVRRAQAI